MKLRPKKIAKIKRFEKARNIEKTVTKQVIETE